MTESLFDPLYSIQVEAPPTVEKLQQLLKKADQSGTGLMKPSEVLSTCQNIENLGFDETELQTYIKEGTEVASDINGNIKLEPFASYLAFEAM
eukprot:UN13558